MFKIDCHVYVYVLQYGVCNRHKHNLDTVFNSIDIMHILWNIKSKIEKRVDKY